MAAAEERITVPASVTIPVLVLFQWMRPLDVMIAMETDAGRKGAAKVLTELYNSIGRELPKEMKFEEKPE